MKELVHKEAPNDSLGAACVGFIDAQQTDHSKKLLTAMREDAVHHNKGVTDKVAKESCKRGTVMTDVLFGVYFGEAAKAYKKIAVTAGKHIRDYEAIPAIERTDEQGTGVFDLMREALEKPAMLAQDMSKMYLLQALLRMFGHPDSTSNEMDHF